MRTPTQLVIASRIGKADVEAKAMHVLDSKDVDVLVTRDTKVMTPDGRVLAIFRKAAIDRELCVEAYPILTKIRKTSFNRGLAAGGDRVKMGKTTYAVPVLSSIVGSIEAGSPRFPVCRQTVWTKDNLAHFEALFPYFRSVAEVFRADAPERYVNQIRQAELTKPEWIIPGTPYTTVTVNNTYATGVHQDVGDLKTGMSCLTVIKRGRYLGGYFCLPQYRIGFDVCTGDVLLMDPHEWHGNTFIQTGDKKDLTEPTEDAERISVVLYYRTETVKCDTMEEETKKWANAKGRRLEDY